MITMRVAIAALLGATILLTAPSIYAQYQRTPEEQARIKALEQAVEEAKAKAKKADDEIVAPAEQAARQAAMEEAIQRAREKAAKEKAAREKAEVDQVCSECHAVEKGQARSPNSRSPTFVELANTPGMTVMALTVMLTTPHAGMPMFVLTADQRANIIAYILGLKE